MTMKYALLLALVIAVSGCTMFSSNVTPTNAIVINSFDVDPQILENTDVATFFLDVENVGGTTASCVISELYGVESWYDITGQSLAYLRPWRTSGVGFAYGNGQVSFSYWDPSNGFVSFSYSRQAGMGLGAYIGSAWSQFTGNFCNSASSWTQFPEVKYIDSLKPAVPSQNKAGQSFTTQWQMRPPILPEGVAQNYAITARTSYLYETNGHMNIQVYNKAEQQRRDVLGQSGSQPVAIEMSYATPIQIVAKRGINPIVVNQQASGYEIVNYLFEFQNTGNGWPLPFGSDVNNQNGFMLATVELSGPGASFYDCLGARSGTELFIPGDIVQSWVKLRADRTAPFGCTIAIDRNAWVDNPMGTASLTFNLWYRYYTDAATSAKVLGVQPNY